MYRELLVQIDGYITGNLGLSQFELWVVGNLQRFINDGDKEAIDAINRVDVLLVQLGDDVIDSIEFAETLQKIVDQRQMAAFHFTVATGEIYSEPAHVVVTVGNKPVIRRITSLGDVPFESVGTSTSAGTPIISPLVFAASAA